MEPFASGTLRIDLDDDTPEPAGPPAVPVSPRRADVDAKQARVARLLADMGCEAVLLLMPAHVSWFTSGLNARGLLADSERPGLYVNPTARWVVCSNVDTQRLFDEELDLLGFQVKEWSWEGGRTDLLSNLVQGKKVATDRPLPGMPMANERLRPLLRVLSAYEQDEYRTLGRIVAHAVEASARGFARGQTEEEVAGQVGHRMLHRGAEPAAISVTADGRGESYRRAGFTDARIEHTCVLQATAQKGGLFASASRTVTFGPPPDEFRTAHELAVRQAVVFRSLTGPESTIGGVGIAGRAVLANTPYEYDWRLSQPGYGAGRFPAEELRRAGHDEQLAAGQAVVWQPRVGPAAVVETVLVTADGSEAVTPPEEWPFKRANIRGKVYDIADILIRPET
jgi:Xaa-Pro aminopeptidase